MICHSDVFFFFLLLCLCFVYFPVSSKMREGKCYPSFLFMIVRSLKETVSTFLIRQLKMYLDCNCTPKIHKNNFLLGPMVGDTAIIGYSTPRWLANSLSCVVGKTKHPVQNAK